MITLTTGQIEAWLVAWLWPFLRIGACLMVAPMFGASFVPARFRLVMAGAIALAIAPLLPPLPAVSPFSGEGLIITAQQVLIGVAIDVVEGYVHLEQGRPFVPVHLRAAHGHVVALERADRDVLGVEIVSQLADHSAKVVADLVEAALGQHGAGNNEQRQYG